MSQVSPRRYYDLTQSLKNEELSLMIDDLDFLAKVPSMKQRVTFLVPFLINLLVKVKLIFGFMEKMLRHQIFLEMLVDTCVTQ